MAAANLTYRSGLVPHQAIARASFCKSRGRRCPKGWYGLISEPAVSGQPNAITGRRMGENNRSGQKLGKIANGRCKRFVHAGIVAG